MRLRDDDMASKTFEARIELFERLANSASGNPRYRVAFAERTVRGDRPIELASTASDSDFVYGMRMRVPYPAMVTIGGRGTITDITELDSDEYQEPPQYAPCGADLLENGSCGAGHLDCSS
jgi:hypothetical protein